MPERNTTTKSVYEVLCGDTVICSVAMGLTKAEADNKVENEKRLGIVNGGWKVWRVPVRMERA